MSRNLYTEKIEKIVEFLGDFKVATDPYISISYYMGDVARFVVGVGDDTPVCILYDQRLVLVIVGDLGWDIAKEGEGEEQEGEDVFHFCTLLL